MSAGLPPDGSGWRGRTRANRCINIDQIRWCDCTGHKAPGHDRVAREGSRVGHGPSNSRALTELQANACPARHPLSSRHISTYPYRPQFFRMRALDILLIPGFMLDADLWSDVRAVLGRHGRVIDADTTQDMTIEAMADRAIRKLSAPATVIGFSMGGYVARTMVYRAPDKVKGLALIATSPRAHAPSAIRPGMTFRRLGQAAIARSLHPDHRTEALMRRVEQMSERLGPEVFRRQSEMARADDSAMLTHIHCPTLIVAAPQDELRSIAESEMLHNGIAGSTMQIVERSGHLIPMEQPDVLGAALEDFIADISPR